MGQGLKPQNKRKLSRENAAVKLFDITQINLNGPYITLIIIQLEGIQIAYI